MEALMRLMLMMRGCGWAPSARTLVNWDEVGFHMHDLGKFGAWNP